MHKSFRLYGLCDQHRRRLMRSKLKEATKRSDLWTQEEMEADPRKKCDLKGSEDKDLFIKRHTVHLKFHEKNMTGDFVYYTRDDDSSHWKLKPSAQKTCDRVYPDNVMIYAAGDVPLRTCKNHASFNKDTLQRMLEAQRILTNMVLFHCLACHERFPTFHPEYMPEFELDCLASYPWKVFKWFGGPPTKSTTYATCHRGLCKRCVDDLATVYGNDYMKLVGLWTDVNSMDLLHGLRVKTVEPYLKELRYLLKKRWLSKKCPWPAITCKSQCAPLVWTRSDQAFLLSARTSSLSLRRSPS